MGEKRVVMTQQEGEATALVTGTKLPVCLVTSVKID